MLTVVIDCSMTMAWHFPDEHTIQTEAVLKRLDTETAMVPSHWVLEVTNVLVQAIKRGRTTESAAIDFLDQLQRLNIVAEAAPGITSMPAILTLARSHRLTTYDAAYLELVQRRKLELASLDEELRAAAISLGFTVVGK